MPEHLAESAPPAAAVIPAAVRESGADVAADEELLATTPWRRGPFVQRKLQLGSVDDPLEDEADRVAEHVMRMPGAPVVQHQCAECDEEDDAIEIVRRKPSYAVMRKCSACEKEDTAARPAMSFVQRQSTSDGAAMSDGAAAPPIVHHAIREAGQPLDTPTRAFFEPRFGRDFGSVRVHTGAEASRAARLIDAQAYTAGDDIAFAAGRFNPDSQDGRMLLAHELAHVVQQRGSDAAPVVQREPDAPTAKTPARRGFLIKVFVNEPVTAREFCIRAVAQGHAIKREQAERLLDAGTLRCYGPQAAHGVSGDWVGQPIPFYVNASLPGEGAPTATPVDVKVDAGEKAELAAKADERFWARIGEIRMLSKTDPKDAEYREVWKSEFEAVLSERRSSVEASDVEYDPFTSELRSFAALGGLQPASEPTQVPPDQMAWMMQVQEMLAGLSELDWVRLRRIGVPSADWQTLAGWLTRFIAQQRADERAIAKVSALDKLRNLDSAYEAVHGAGRGSRDEAGAEVYGRADELEKAAAEFRSVFRTRAVEVAFEMLRHAAVAVELERVRLRSREERTALFAFLANNPTIPEEVLNAHPILRDPQTRKNVRNPRTAYDLGEWMLGEAYRQAERIKFVSAHLHEKPNVVFGFDVVVAVTLHELGLNKSVHETIIRMGWGQSDGSSLFRTLREFGLMALMFVPVIGPLVGAVVGFEGFDAAMKEYSANKHALAMGLRTTEPSKTGVILGTVGLAAGGLVFMHQIATTAKSFGQIERLGVTEAGAAGRAEATLATTGTGEKVATEAGVTTAGTGEKAVVEAGESVAGARTGARAVEEVPVKGGHHVKATERGIEICSPDPCPILRAEYAKELAALEQRGNTQLTQRLDAIDKLRLTDPAQATRAAAHVRESLQYIRAHGELFRALPSHITPSLETRLAELLNAAEDAGVQLTRDQLGQISRAIAETTEVRAAEQVIAALEENFALHIQVRTSFGEAGAVGGGSRAGDVATQLPGGTHALGRATRYPKEVSAFLQRYPKVRATPDSEAALDALYAHTKSGALPISPRPGRFQPIETRAAESELESIVELSGRAEVRQIELVPSSFEGRTADKIVDIRQADGSIVRTRWEDTTITGARSGYQVRGAGGRGTAETDRIASSIRGKITSTPERPSQFDALMVEAPQGGTLAVHIPRPGPTGVQDVADAMARVGPELRNSTVQAVEFFLPGQQALRRQVLRYVRQSDGSFVLITP